MKFLCAAIDRNRDHERLFGKGAIFDLEPHRHGWSCFSKVSEGDIAYIIAPDRRVHRGYRICRVDKAGERIVIFSESIVDRPGIPYQAFIKQRRMTDNRISPVGNMLRGFNVVCFAE